MHMGNELVSPATGFAMLAVSGAVLSYAGRRAVTELDEHKIPLAGVMGAFVFAAQMINFPVLAGTSGHLGGGMLLAILFGPHIAVLVMASILAIQCLIFQDGGLLALGMNIFNLGIIPAYGGSGIYLIIRREVRGNRGIWAGAFLGSFLSVVTGAVLVPLEVKFAGVFEVPLAFFMTLMGGVHVLIGIVEGMITVSVLRFLLSVKPDVFNGNGFMSLQTKAAFNRISLIFLFLALFLSGYFSYYASSHPDGLDWALERMGFQESLTLPAGREPAPPEAASLPGMPDYEIPNAGLKTFSPHLSRGLAGAAGSVITVIVLVIAGGIIRRIRRIKA